VAVVLPFDQKLHIMMGIVRLICIIFI